MAATIPLIVLLPLLFLFAWAARRLLAVRWLSATKTVIATLIGFLLGEVLAVTLSRRGADDTTAAVAGVIAAVIFTMVAMVVLELLSSPGRRRRRRRAEIPNPVRGARRQVAQAGRAIEVARIARKQGLGAMPSAHATEEEASDYGKRVAAALEEAGGMFVKFGQVLSTRQDIIPPAAAKELAKLQGDVSPEPREVMEPVLEKQLGRSVDTAFADFDWDPIGSASIGQVYQASLPTGEPVVVKVRRPGIVDLVERDLAIVARFARTLESRTEVGSRYGVSAIADEFGENLRNELDYRNEVRGAQELSAALAEALEIYVPHVYEEMSTESVLVMERLIGPTLGSVESVGEFGLDPRRTADMLFKSVVGTMIAGETFHADLHPGNVIILETQRLGLIDFGSTARLDAFEQAAVSDITMALYLRDPTLLREAAMTVGSFPEGADVVQLERAFARLMAQHLGATSIPTADLLTDFLAIAYQFGMTMPPTVTAMFRALATLSGTLDVINGGPYPLIEAAQDLASDRLYGELAGDSLPEMVRTEALRMAPLLQRAPRRLDRIAGQVERGELTTRVSLFSTPADVQIVTRLANRAILAFLAATLGVVSALLFRAEGSIVLFDETTLLDALAFVGLIGGSILIMRVILEVLHDDGSGG